MALSIEDVCYIAGLARLRFTEEEEQHLARQMSAILEYMDTLNELDTIGVPPMSHVLNQVNLTRDDAAAPRISMEQALQNAPDADGEYFRVPKVIE